jgi:hypothetical protein
LEPFYPPVHSIPGWKQVAEGYLAKKSLIFNILYQRSAEGTVSGIIGASTLILVFLKQVLPDGENVKNGAGWQTNKKCQRFILFLILDPCVQIRYSVNLKKMDVNSGGLTRFLSKQIPVRQWRKYEIR